MFTKLKENILKDTSTDWKNKISYPLYYKENDKTIKELENGEKWIVTLDNNYKEVLVKRIK